MIEHRKLLAAAIAEQAKVSATAQKLRDALAKAADNEVAAQAKLAATKTGLDAARSCHAVLAAEAFAGGTRAPAGPDMAKLRMAVLTAEDDCASASEIVAELRDKLDDAEATIRRNDREIDTALGAAIAPWFRTMIERRRAAACVLRQSAEAYDILSKKRLIPDNLGQEAAIEFGHAYGEGPQHPSISEALLSALTALRTDPRAVLPEV